MTQPVNIIIGIGIVVLNLVPFIIKKPKYLFLTILLSFLMLFLLISLK